MSEMSVDDLMPKKSLGLVDVTKYEGKRPTIEKLSFVQVESQWANGKKLPDGNTVPAWRLKVESEVLDTIKRDDGSMTEVRARNLFPISVDANGKSVYHENEKNRLTKFLKRVGVSLPKELKGKQSIVLKKGNFLEYAVD